MHFRPTYAHIYTYLLEDTILLDNCTHNYAYGSLVMDTRVHFLQLVRLQAIPTLVKGGLLMKAEPLCLFFCEYEDVIYRYILTFWKISCIPQK